MDIPFAVRSIIACLIILTATTIALLFPSPVLVLGAILVAGLTGYLLSHTNSQRATRSKSQNNDQTDDLSRNHQLLLDSVKHNPMPYAIYDEHDRLYAWNQPYEKMYTLAFDNLKRRGDASSFTYEDLVRSNAREELQGQELEDYVEQRVSDQRKDSGSVVDRQYPETGWFRVSKYTIPSGGVAGFAIDINELKQRESELMLEIEHRKRLEVEIREIANTDELTGIANRRSFLNQCDSDFKYSKASGTPLCCFMIDIDLFKPVNDTYGHAVGDEVIATVAKTISSTLHSHDATLGRMGGEEFALVTLGKTLHDAEILAEKIRDSVQWLVFIARKREFKITVSIGVAELTDHDNEFRELIKRSDDALYAAKHSGRNCIMTDLPEAKTPLLKQG